MIDHLLLIFSAICVYEFVKYINLKKIILNNFIIVKKIVKLLAFKNVSDLRKEKLLFYYSKSLFVLSSKIFAIILVVIFFIVFLNLLSVSFLSLIISVIGICEITFFFFIYHVIRRGICAKL